MSGLVLPPPSRRSPHSRTCGLSSYHPCLYANYFGSGDGRIARDRFSCVSQKDCRRYSVPATTPYLSAEVTDNCRYNGPHSSEYVIDFTPVETCDSTFLSVTGSVVGLMYQPPPRSSDDTSIS
jgi:hypothetical protein